MRGTHSDDARPPRLTAETENLGKAIEELLRTARYNAPNSMLVHQLAPLCRSDRPNLSPSEPDCPNGSRRGSCGLAGGAQWAAAYPLASSLLTTHGRTQTLRSPMGSDQTELGSTESLHSLDEPYGATQCERPPSGMGTARFAPDDTPPMRPYLPTPSAPRKPPPVLLPSALAAPPALATASLLSSPWARTSARTPQPAKRGRAADSPPLPPLPQTVSVLPGGASALPRIANLKSGCSDGLLLLSATACLVARDAASIIGTPPAKRARA